jgi:hypothetical protein
MLTRITRCTHHRRAASILAPAALVSVAAIFGSSSVARAQVPVIDGTRDAVYGNPFSVQTVQTGFGDNQSELDAGSLKIQNGKLYLMLTGNLESNFNKLIIFFDTRAGGQNVMRSDNPDVDFNALNTKYAGMKFDTGFSPDYALWWSGNTTDMFLNFSELNTNGGGSGGFLGSVQTPNPNRQGAGTVGGTGGLPRVDFGYNDSNVAGVAGGSDAADQTAAAAVTTGNEVAIDLSQLGATENFTMMIGINGSSHDFWSNQFLKGLVPPQGNLGGDGNGNFTGNVGSVDFSTIAGDQFLSVTYHAPLSQWSAAGNGNWSDATKWTGDGVPNAPDARAVLGTLGGTGAKTITLDTNVALQSLTFDSTGTYTIAGSGTNAITITGNPASPAVLVNSGNHTIAAPIVLGATTNFTVATGSTLRVTGDVTATGQTVVKAGGGSVQFPNLRAAGLFVGEGTVSIATNGTNTGASDLGNLSFAGGTTPTAALDVNDNDVVLRSGTFETVAPLIRSGRANGAWTGQGITSSAARTQPNHATTIGLMTGADYHAAAGGSATFDGFTVADTDMLMKYTWYGDTDFNGRVNFDDYVRTDNGFNNHLTGWLNGDFDLNGVVNFDDYVLIDLAFNTQTGTLGRALSFLDGSDKSQNGMNDAALRRIQDHLREFGNDYANHFLAAVPEPSAIALSGVAAFAAMSRRRRRPN